MKKYIPIGIACVLALLIINTSTVNSKITSPPAGSSGDPFTNATCAQSGCHASPAMLATSNDVTILIGTGTPTTPLNSSFSYTPGVQYNVAFSILQTATIHPFYGFQIVALNSSNAQAGTMTVTNAAVTQVNTISARQYMGHRNSNSTHNWTFKWTAPAASTGPVSFYYSFIACDASVATPSNPEGTTYHNSVTIQEGVGSPAVNLGSNQSVCSGTAVFLNPVISGGQAPYTYAWSATGNSLSCNSCQNPDATITQNSTFYVTVTDANNNTCTDNIVYTNSGPCTQCVSGPSACTPTGGPAAGGFEDPSTTPCAVQSSAYSHAIQFTMFNSFDFQGHQSVDSIEFMSIDNLPCGLCWALNKTNKRYAANEDGCLSINGTTTDAAGQYKLAIALKVWINGQTTPGLVIPASVVDQTGIRLFLRVKTPAGSCANVDTSVNGTNLIASASCALPFSVGLGSNQTVCSGAAVTLNPVVSGGQSPYTYAWSATGNALSCNNCQSPTATITQTSVYTVTVTDNSSATATASITYTMGSSSFQISANGPTTFCQGGSVTLSAGAGFAAYHWSNNATGSSINAGQSGTYSVTVTTGGGCTLTNSISVTANAPTINNYQITANGPTSFCSGGSVTLNAGSGFNSYHWSNNSGAQTITVSQTGTYSVTAVGTDGCTYTDNQSVNTNTSFTGQTICIVSVDPISGKNVIVWEKSSGFGVDSFRVYKETGIANQYQMIRQQVFGNFSTYEDAQSNPQQASSRYVITTVDACGESQYSTPHQTIHLTSNVGINNEVNLIWNAYQGISYPSFNIYRGTNQSNLSQIAQVSANTFSYTDLTPPSPPLYYQIEIVNPQGCVPTAKNESYGSSLSNVVQLNSLSVGTTTVDAVSAYSYYNEAAGANMLHINFNQQATADLRLYDVAGRSILAIDDITGAEIQLPSTIASGIYVAEFMSGSTVKRFKIFVR